MTDQAMVVSGTLDRISHLKVSGDLLITVRVPKEMANEAFRRIGGFPSPETSRWVAVAVMNDPEFPHAEA